MTMAGFEKRTEEVMALSAIVFLVSWAAPIIWEGKLPDWAVFACDVGMRVTWFVIIADYLIRLWRAPKKLTFMATNVVMLLSVLIPMLRPLQLLSFLAALNRQASARLRGRVTTYAVGGSIVLMLSGAVAVLAAERHVGNITNIGEALWWSIVTVTSVGYGDYYPVTTEGRLIAAGLMITGIALLGAVTAILASWLTDQVASETQDKQQRMLAEISALRAELKHLQDQDGQPSNESDGQNAKQDGGDAV